MIGSSAMHHRPYIRASEQTADGRPYISRLIPKENGFEFYFIDNNDTSEHFVEWCERGSENLHKESVEGTFGSVTGLEENHEYIVTITRANGVSSYERIVKTGREMEGVVTVDYLHPDDMIFDFSGRALGAPSLVRLPSGALLAADCVFCDRTSWPSLPNLSRLFRSDDEGKNWDYVCDLMPSFNGSLFVYRERLYFLTLDGDYCNLVITASDDEGKTWCDPVTLFRGESTHRWGWHSSAMPIFEHNGRLYKAIEFGHVAEYGTNREDAPEDCWTCNGMYFDLAHHLGVLSIGADDDLLVAKNWCMSDLYYPKDVDPYQCIEGNIVHKDGELYNIVRTMQNGISLKMTLDKNPESVMHSPTIYKDFPLSAISKFEIKFDEQTGYYIALGNDATVWDRQRLVMAVSKDLENWTIALEIADGRGTENAFSYPDFIFSGDDILLLSRTAYNGAKNNHDTNMITFHKIENFRKYF